ncbi:MAG: nicotinate (nicotinamide) nucleotide adenylyltransferase [Leptolyngbyaceae cyanobacterium SM1_3_5]|nr:nicotinate (nicotinamide) nucleotide adenylyltransferase [Leptolyngbyaceae cyanobacterium SM1_3_5]
MNGEATATPPRRAIFGGTFNPVHYAHLEIARAAEQQFHLNEIIWVPTIAPHYKTQVASLEHRLAMVKQAIAPYPNFTPVCLSVRFAIEIFTTLQIQKAPSHWFWLIGLDAFTTLPRWVDRDQLASVCEWLIAPRGAADKAQAQIRQVEMQLQAEGIALRWQMLDRSPSPISSSLVRDRCQAILPIAKLVPMPVQTYIQQHGLYRS